MPKYNGIELGTYTLGHSKHKRIKKSGLFAHKLPCGEVCMGRVYRT